MKDLIDLHDINNDLTQIGLLIQTVINTEGAIISERSKDCLKNVNSRIFHLAKKVKSILMPTEVDKIRMTPISELLLKFRDDLEKEFELKIHFSGNSDLKLDQGTFYDFITNISKNANEAGASRLKIAITNRTLSFIDNGSGFTKEVIKAFHAKQRLTTKENGHGLGLLSLNEIARKAKLTMDIRNNAISGGGTIIFTKLDSS
ncbi:MAG: hypothetical protein KC478_10675 [Bacteriovoracaceae bacterium]|nr:hypothetical protein [Bacteriovoracaceae bacterium]